MKNNIYFISIPKKRFESRLCFCYSALKIPDTLLNAFESNDTPVDTIVHSATIKQPCIIHLTGWLTHTWFVIHLFTSAPERSVGEYIRDQEFVR